MSKIRYLMLMLVFLIASSISVQTTAKAEEYFSFDNGLNVEGRTLLPMRSLFESLGATVSWEQATSTVTATKDNKTIVLTIGSKQAKVNGKTIQIDVPALIIDGSTYVPVRFVTESLGAKVDWDPSLKRATVHYDGIRVDISVTPAVNVSGVTQKFHPNPSYTYVYIPYEGTDRRTFVGMNGNQYVWNSQYSYGVTEPARKIYYSENEFGLYKTETNYYGGGTTTTREIKYPAYVGQSWSTEEYGESTTRVIVNVGSTIKTPVKTFNNVIEVMDEHGLIRYYAEGFGFVHAEHAYEEYSYGVALKVLKKR